MPKRIDFEGQTHEFPDDFSDGDISAALSNKKPAPAEGTGFAASLGKIGDAGRKYVSETASGIGEAVKKYGSAVSLNPLKNAKMTVEGVANLASAALQQPINLISPDPGHPLLQVPRFEGDNPITDVVGAVSKPITDTLSKVSGVVGDATGVDPRRIEAGLNTASMAVPALRGGKAPVAPKALGTMADNPVAAARAFGDKVRPSDIAKAEPETSVKTTRYAEGAAGSKQLRERLMEHNQKNGTAKGLEDIGIAKTEPRVTPKLLDKASQPALAKYREVGRTVGQFDPTDAFNGDLDAITAPDQIFTPEARSKVAQEVDQYRSRSMSGADSVKTISALRRKSARDIKSNDVNVQDIGFARRAVADAIESEIERKLTADGHGQLVTEFKDARQQLAKVHDVDTATVGGQIDRHILKKLQDKNAKLSGNLKILADSADMFPHVTRRPGSIADEGGNVTIPGLGAILDVGSVGARPAIRKFLGSDFYQNQLGRPATDLQSQLGEYFPKPPEPPKAPPAPPEPPPELPKTPSSAMLEAQKRAGDLSLADEILNPQQLPEAPSRLTADVPPAPRGGLPFKASQPSAIDLAGDMSLAPEITSEGLPFNPKPHGVSDLELAEDARVNAGPLNRVGGNRLADEALDPRSESKRGPFAHTRSAGVDFQPSAVGQYLAPSQMLEAGRPRLSDLTLAEEGTQFPPSLPREPSGPPPAPSTPKGSPGFNLADDFGIDVVPSVKRKGMFELRHNGETEGVAFKSEAEAKAAALDLADQLVGDADELYRAPPRVKNEQAGNGALPANAFDEIFDENTIGELKKILRSNGGKGATAAVDDAFQNNASGESSASVEAINRVKSEKAAGQDRFVIEPNGTVTPLRGVDAVDAVARKGQVIVQRSVGDKKYSVLDRGGLSKRAAENRITMVEHLLDKGE